MDRTYVILTEGGVVIGTFKSYGEAEEWLGAGEGEIRPISMVGAGDEKTRCK